VTFASRQDAGHKLGQFLRQRGIKADLVLGLPRGGVVVAAEAAHVLNLPLDVVVVRKIGHPFQREFAIGALAEPDLVFLSSQTASFRDQQALDDVITEETKRLREYSRRFHRSGMPVVEGKTVLLVDDGLATGATAEAAVHSVRARGARWIIVAAPVAALDAAGRLRQAADAVEVLVADEAFEAVGQYYRGFAQATDEEVISLLRNPLAKAA